MKVSASIENTPGQHQVTVQTNENAQVILIPGKATGLGSAVNGGELLCVALATCFCNDVYREAQRKNMQVTKVIVEASAEFGGPGEPGYNITYSARVEGNATAEALQELIRHTDTVAEVQNTLRAGVKVKLIS